MSIFEQLNNYWIEKGPAEAHMSMFRENEKDTKHLYKDVSEEAKLAAKDDGHEEGTDAFTAIVERIQRGIDKKNSQENTAKSSIQKGKRGDLYVNDPHAIAAQQLINDGECESGDRGPDGLAPPWGKEGGGDFHRGSDCSRRRDKIADGIKQSWARGKKTAKKGSTQKMMQKEDVPFEKLSPGVQSLIAFGAGWALSGDLVNNEVPAHLVREWERAIARQASDADRRRLEDKIKRSVRKSEEEAVTILNDFFLLKDHAPVPPRVGRMWDAVKHRWTRPERIGRTVWELSGHKRIRGTGTGSHERSVKVGGIGGRGAGSASAGRRFRSLDDAGKLNPHDAPKAVGAKGRSKHPAIRHLKVFRRKGGKKK